MCVIRLSAWRYTGIYTRWKSWIVSPVSPPVFCPQAHFNPVNDKFIIQFHKMRHGHFIFSDTIIWYGTDIFCQILWSIKWFCLIACSPCNMPDCPIYAFCMIYDIFIIWNGFRALQGILRDFTGIWKLLIWIAGYYPGYCIVIVILL